MKLHITAFTILFATTALLLAGCPITEQAVSVTLGVTPTTADVISGGSLTLEGSWLPASASVKVEWTSDLPTIAAVKGYSTDDCVTIIGAKPGLATITLNATNVESVTATPKTATVNVLPRPLQSDTWTSFTAVSSNSIYFAMDAVQDLPYLVEWKEYGIESLTGRVFVSVVASDLSTVLGPEQDISSNSPGLTFTRPANETVYIVVRPDAARIGSFKLMCSNNRAVDSVAIDPTTCTIESTSSSTFSATASPADASQGVIWTSSNSSIVTMGADGTAYAFTPGSATVTATSVKDATKLATATVTVTEKPLTFGAWTDGEFRADPYSSSYYVWYSFPAVAGTSYKVEWNDSANGDSTKTLNVSATCYHQDKNYTYFAYTDSGYGPNAKIFTATTTETAFIRIGRSSTSNTGTFSLRVEAMDPVDSVSIPATASLDSGASLQLVATVLPATANQGVTWTTSDLAVASVSSGTVLGKKPGTASITVKSSTDPTKTASCVVTVSAASLPLNGSWTGITASSTYDTWYSVPITAGKCYEFMVDDYRSSPGTYPAWLKKEAYRGDTTTPYFSSTLAMFETSSRFVVPAAGETVIYFRLTYYITSGAARVAVKEWDLPASVAISGPSTISAPGDTAQLSASVLPATAPQRVTWTSQASGIMSVGATTGLVTAEAYGGATIQATSSADPALTATHDVVLAEPAKKSAWTVMYYSDADCDLEAALMSDIAEMKAGLREDADINVILLVDRHPSSSSPYSSDAVTLGTNFSDTRLFRILPGSFMRLNGSTQFPEITTTSTYEANMGDANTLRKFIDFCKANYPATNYALFVSNHGAGSRSNPSDDSRSSIKGVCFDETSSNDCLYTAELTDVLDSTHSVDLFAFDACFMGTAEVAYQYRPGTGDFSADYMVASGPTVWGAGFPYTKILERLRTGGGNNGTVDSTVGGLEAYLDPATMTAAQFGALIVEEQYDDTSANPTYGNGQELGVFDLSAMATLKTLVDEFAVLLWSENEKVDFEAIRGSYSTTYPIDYFAQSNEIEWLAYPYFDLYSLVGLVSTSANFSTAVKAKAEEIKTAVDAVVLYSFGNSDYSGFVPGKHGLSIFFPDGDRSYSSNPMWGYQWWYSPIDTNAWWTGGHYYGKLAWCADGRNATASAVGNWFELLDSWFDTSNTATGGVNGVQW